MYDSPTTDFIIIADFTREITNRHSSNMCPVRAVTVMGQCNLLIGTGGSGGVIVFASAFTAAC